MMSNLFSTFDPSTQIMSMNWLSSLTLVLILPQMFWFTPSRPMMLFMIIKNKLHAEFSTLNKNKGSTMIFTSIFLMIMMNNFMGLFPYIFTSSSHLTFTLSLALPMWLSFMIYGWMNNTINMLAHLVPQGTPPILMPFMVCIETISNLIRPGTLAVRLMANMIAGHLLMTLLGNTGNMMTLLTINLLLITQMALLILESAVAIIQSYVFAVLATLYSSEV